MGERIECSSDYNRENSRDGESGAQVGRDTFKPTRKAVIRWKFCTDLALECQLALICCLHVYQKRPHRKDYGDAHGAEANFGVGVSV